MAKKTKRPVRQKKEKQPAGFSLDSILPLKYQIPAALIILFVLLLIFLAPMYFGGQTFQSGDIMAHNSSAPYFDQEKDSFTLWNPYLFGGMPSYAIGIELPWFSLVYVIFYGARQLFTSFAAIEYAQWSFYLIILGITTFFLVRRLTHNTMISLFAGVSTSFSTGLMLFLFIGHVTKLTALAWFPLVLLMLFDLQREVRFVYIPALIIIVQLLIAGFHVQVIFYIFMAIGIYYLVLFTISFVKKNADLRARLLKSLGIFAACTVVASLLWADKFTQIYEYSEYSTRGSKSIVEQESGETQKQDSDYYEYHTNWSFSIGEMMTFIVPSWYGFGNSHYKGPLSNNQEIKINTYFGQMMFVDVPMYMGVLVFFFALFGLYANWKKPFVKFLGILSVVALLLSFGRNFPVLFDLFFFYFPYFDKFRVPSMSLILVQMAFPVLAGYGLWRIVQLRDEADKRLESIVKYAAFAFTGIFALSLLLQGPIGEWFIGRVQETPKGNQFARIFDYMEGMFITDLLVAFGFSAAAFWAAYGYLQRKLTADLMVLAVFVLSLIDLWRINDRAASYTDAAAMEANFTPPGYVEAIQQRNDSEPFRVLNLKQDGSPGSVNQNTNYHMHFLLEDFYGYSGIKPRAYQDYNDVVGLANPTMWRMLNVKYVVTDRELPFPNMNVIHREGESTLYLNNNALPRLYFVDSVAYKRSFDVLQAVKQNAFDPKHVAYIQEEADLQIDPPTTKSSISYVDYQDEIIKLDVNATGNHFLFVGNTYLPSGWNAYIDGEEAHIYRTNHGFMGIIVPEGERRVEIQYLPASFVFSKYLVLILSIMALAALFVGLYMEWKRHKASQKNREGQQEPAAETGQ